MSSGDGTEGHADGVANRLARVLLIGRRDTPLAAHRQSDALHDPLTGLANRQLFLEHLERAAARSSRNPDYVLAILFLDLDRFKSVNDHFGHATGDELLMILARRVEDVVRTNDIVGRYGGDEFIILLDDIGNLANATHVAEQILDVVRLPAGIDGHEVSVNASIGISLSDSSNDTESLIRDSDMAMYRAKGRGRGRFEVFDDRMYGETLARLTLERELRLAAERNEFELTYQPIVHLHTGAITGFEALVSWRHPVRGPLAAQHFLNVADGIGVILNITPWVLGEACSRAAAWQRDHVREVPLTISVNMCAKELNAHGFVDMVRTAVKDAGLAPGTLRLDVSEGAMNVEPEHSLACFSALREIGVELHIDDFGRGFSSLTALKRYPVTSVKIDRALISSMEEEPIQQDLVAAIAGIARTLRIGVIVEGVESAAQLAMVRGMEGCTLAQGYHFWPPLSADDATSLVAEATGWSEDRAPALGRTSGD